MTQITSDSSKKLFGHCKVEWQIDKFTLQTFAKDWWLIQSPEYTVNGSAETRWRMSLQPKLFKRKSLVLLSVKRAVTDPGPKYVWLNVKVCCKISGVKFASFKEKLLPMKNRSKYEVCLGSIEYLLLEINQSDDFFNIVCDMIVYSYGGNRRFGDCNHPGLKLLSENMLDLYTSDNNFDTKLVFGDNVILAHKAILYARNDYLRFLIEEFDDDHETDDEEDGDDELDFQQYTILDFLGLDFKRMRKVLAYLYTGDIRHTVKEPSFAIHQCASFLEIYEIEQLYDSDKLTLKSTIDTEEYSYILCGYDFENSRFTWHCAIEESEKTIRLDFYPKRDQIEDYISLFSETFEKSMLAYLEFNFDVDSKHTRSSHFINVRDGFFDVDRITSGIIRQMDSRRDTFEVNIKLKLTASKQISSIVEYSNVSVSYVNDDYYYECLSQDLEYLLDYGLFTDSLIDNNGTHFWVHKCILASRCRLFADILEINEEGEVIVVKNFDPHTVSVIITYLYTGILLDILDDDVIQVYKASVFSNLPQLKSVCADRLKLFLKTNRNIRCRIVRVAEEYGDVSLKEFVLNDLFSRKQMFLIPSHLLSFADVHACRHCLRAP